jgi:hypothetical protein
MISILGGGQLVLLKIAMRHQPELIRLAATTSKRALPAEIKFKISKLQR